MENPKKLIKLNISERSFFKLFYDEFEEILNLLLSKKNQKITLSEIKNRIPIIRNWKKDTLIEYLYQLEKLEIISIKYFPNINADEYSFDLEDDLIIRFLKIISNKFEIDFKFSKEEYLEFINIAENIALKQYEEIIMNHWKQNIINIYPKSERLQKLIEQRDLELKEYFADTALLNFYNVHEKDKLAAYLAKLGNYIKLEANPKNFLIDNYSAKGKLQDVLIERFKEMMNFTSLNKLIDIENQEIKKLKPKGIDSKKEKEIKLTKAEKLLIPALVKEINKNPNIGKTDLARAFPKICTERTVFDFFKKIDEGKVKGNEFTEIYLEKYSTNNLLNFKQID